MPLPRSCPLASMAQTLYLVAMWTAILFLSITAAQAGQVTLAWNASAGPVAGYHVYYRQQSGSYPATPQQSTASTTATVPNLTDGTYYFVVKAHDGNGTVGGPSNEVSAAVGGTTTPPPSGALPSPWRGMDSGNVGLVGSASYSGGIYMPRGSGTDIRRNFCGNCDNKKRRMLDKTSGILWA